MRTQSPLYRPGHIRAADGYRGIVTFDGKLVAVTVDILPNRNDATVAAWRVLLDVRS